MRRVFSIAVVAMMVMALMITGCAKKETPKETIKVGVAGPHSGDLASYGIPTVRAAELVVEEINAQGPRRLSGSTMTPVSSSCPPPPPTRV
jgi:branched-chain amino acid transport system substrate-binding protein